ncbi:MAG: PP2C family protein-serine/threonine phosphatase [Eubacteriales bacterium]
MALFKLKKLNSAFYSELLNSMSDLVRVVDKNNMVLYENDELAKTFGKTLDTKCYNTLGESEFCGGCALNKKRRRKRFKRRTGEIVVKGRTYSVVVSPINVSLWERGAVEVFRDITQETKLKNRMLARNRKMINDLEVARTLQLSILRDQMPDHAGYRFRSVFMPCETLGGDMFDCFNIRDNKVAMYIADVSGHGVMSAMLTVYLRQEIFSQFKVQTSPDRVLSGLSESFNDLNIESSLYITVFLLVLDLKTGEVSYTNAGHSVAPLLYDGETAKELISPGLPISNWANQPEFIIKKEKLSPGGRILLYTDGLDKIHESASTLEGLKQQLKLKTINGTELLNRIIYKYAINRTDDITLLMVERER